jgi:hypothetical protein
MGTSFVVFRSMKNTNSDDPVVADEWAYTRTYGLGDVVKYNSVIWRSVVAVNEGREPEDLEEDPYWSRVPAPEYESANSWRPIYAGLRNVEEEYVTMQLNNMGGPGKSIFRLPAGFLRRAADHPQFSLPRTDQEPVGKFISSSEPILLINFVASITDVREFDPMFCEGLAAAIAKEVVEVLTQSNDKMQNCVAKYKQYITEARLVNAIEMGSEEPDEDDYITVRN